MALDLLRGAAQGIVGKGLRKVAGNLPGLLGFNKGRGGNSSDTASLESTKFTTQAYSFPGDVTAQPGTGNQGHYIMFFINQQTNAKLGFGGEKLGAGQKTMQEEAARTATYIVVAVILTIILLTVAAYFLVPPHILKAFCPCCAPCLQHKDDYVKHRKMLNDSDLENVRLEMTASSNARRLSVQQGDDGMYTNQSIDRRSRLTQVKSRKVGSIEVLN